MKLTLMSRSEKQIVIDIDTIVLQKIDIAIAIEIKVHEKNDIEIAIDLLMSGSKKVWPKLSRQVGPAVTPLCTFCRFSDRIVKT